MNNKLNLKLGCDPEFFASVNVNNKDYVISPALLEKDSGLNFLYQDEHEKHPVYIDENEFSIMMDGVAFEYTLKHPCNSPQEIFRLLNNANLTLQQFLSGFKWNNLDLKFYNKPVIHVNPDWYLPYLYINKIYQGFIFGCDPDKDAIRPDYVCKTLNVEKHPYRYGGGHIHVSGLNEFSDFPIPAIKLLAITAGNFSIANSLYPKLEKQRATTYGKPGRYREQKYKNGDIGIEYRTPSNSWTSYELEKMEEFFEYIHKGCEFLVNRRGDIIEKYLDKTILSIISADQNLAKEILNDIDKE
jgi:hypothetical protein